MKLNDFVSPLHLRANFSHARDAVELFGVAVNGRILRIESVYVREDEPGVAGDPFAVMDRRAAQVLMDDLYLAGFRPSDGDSPGELAATKHHLKSEQEIRRELLSAVLAQLPSKTP